MYNLSMVVEGFDRLNTNVYRKSTACQLHSLCYQIHTCHQGNVGNNRLALRVRDFHRSTVGIPFSSSQIHHTVNEKSGRKVLNRFVRWEWAFNQPNIHKSGTDKSIARHF